MNARTYDDHCLLIRKAIQGDITWDAVCEQLVAQHSRIHEKDPKGYHQGYSKFVGVSKPWQNATSMDTMKTTTRRIGTVGHMVDSKTSPKTL